MNRPFRLGLILGICHGLLMAGSPSEVPCKWSALSALVAKHKVALVLPAGTRVEGRAVRVEADGLRLRVTKTSDRRAVAGGERLIPRQSVSVLRLTEYRKLGRLLCTLGATGLAGGIVATRSIDIYEGPAVILVPALAAAGTVGAGVAGYFIGKRVDKRVIYIRISPED